VGKVAQDIAADLTPEQRGDFTIRKQILWESATASNAEARAVEARLIVEMRANEPDRGYNVLPRLKP
jgi:hypothetical protein